MPLTAAHLNHSWCLRVLLARASCWCRVRVHSCGTQPLKATCLRIGGLSQQTAAAAAQSTAAAPLAAAKQHPTAAVLRRQVLTTTASAAPAGPPHGVSCAVPAASYNSTSGSDNQGSTTAFPFASSPHGTVAEAATPHSPPLTSTSPTDLAHVPRLTGWHTSHSCTGNPGSSAAAVLAGVGLAGSGQHMRTGKPSGCDCNGRPS